MAPIPDSTAARTGSAALLLFGVLLVATNFRAPITAIGPVLEQVRAAFALGTAQAGLLTTLPLLAFAVVSPFAAALARRFGLERTLFGALVVIAAGIALRSAPAVACLYLGTALVGAGIAVGNVLLPGLVKRDHPDDIARVTVVYSMTMGLVAALASMLAVPLAKTSGGWPLALGAMIVLPLASAVAWIPHLRRHARPAPDAPAAPREGRVWSSALAWHVTLFLGLNSFVYYVVVSWLPAILAERGYAATAAGNLHGLLQLATSVVGLLLLPLVRRLDDQRPLAAGVALLTCAGLAGLCVAPGAAVLWVALIGLGAGATFILALSFVGLRSARASQAAALSGMAQCVGYLLAATGPTLAGALHDAAGGWNAVLALCATASLVTAVFGVLAARRRTLDDAPLCLRPAIAD